jgi:hypothetical protein
MVQAVLMTDLLRLAQRAGAVINNYGDHYTVAFLLGGDFERFTALMRAQTLEEAAVITDGVNNHNNPMTAHDCSDAIRALAQKGKDHGSEE